MYRPSVRSSETEFYNIDQSLFSADVKYQRLSTKSDCINEILETLIDQQNDPFNTYFMNSSTPPPDQIDRDFFLNDDQNNETDLYFPGINNINEPYSKTINSNSESREKYSNLAFPTLTTLDCTMGLHSYEQGDIFESDQQSLGIQFSRQCSLTAQSYVDSQKTSDLTVLSDAYLTYDQLNNANPDLTSCQSPVPTSTQFSQISYSSPYYDRVTDYEQLHTWNSNLSSNHSSSCDNGDFDESNMSLTNISSPSTSDTPSPATTTTRKRIPLVHLSEEQKYLRIRDQNNLASREYRQRKKTKKQEIEEEWKKLNQKNMKLKNHVKSLQTTVDRCYKLKSEIESSGYSFPVSNLH